ncbi:MFS transporter [Massilia suwonensis]|jgi:predicted MFS family arabinose efflux permease|uniref:MFS transporter n=1 Tax=Massilia suwonensis TaxID=648895 RepID=A0ABW0MK70_9BURK
MTTQWRAIGILACTQIVSWGSLYYAFSILAPSIQRELGWSPTLVFGAYSWSLLIAGLVATPIGILLDRHGGQMVMGAGSVVCAIGFFLLSESRSPAAYVTAWTILGLAMGLTLYEAAFATINRRFASAGRQAISTLTLFAGFASTIFWPLTQALNMSVGWRDSYLWFSALQLLICLPLHLLLGREQPLSRCPVAVAQRGHTLAEAVRHPAFWKLAMAFSANIFVFSALSVHLIPLLHGLGHSARVAILVAMLIGPMQVAGRILERTVARDTAPQTVGKFCFSTLPAALIAVLWFGTQAWAVAVFCILYGLSNGIITIVRGTLPQAMFGSENYGAISGALAGPALLAKASGPIIAAWVLGQGGTPTLLLGVLFGVAVASVSLYFAAIRGEAPRAITNSA